MIKNSNLTILARLGGPKYTYIFAWNTKTEKYIVKRERFDVVTEDHYKGGGLENRRVMRDRADMESFYRWAIGKGFSVIKPLA